MKNYLSKFPFKITVILNTMLKPASHYKIAKNI